MFFVMASAEPKPDFVSDRADDGDRTRDPQLGKLLLYQLSYVRADSILAWS
jgi:hypothetical protein